MQQKQQRQQQQYVYQQQHQQLMQQIQQTQQLTRRQRQIESLYSSILRDRTTEQWSNFVQHAATAKQQLGFSHLSELLLIEMKRGEANYTEMRDFINNSQQQNNPILRFFSAEAAIHEGDMNAARQDLDRVVQLLEPFDLQRCGEISEDGSNLQYSPIYCSIYFHASILKSSLVLKNATQYNDASAIQAIADFEKICDLLWKNSKLFELFDALALFHVQYSMLNLAVVYRDKGEIIKAIQFLRRFFLPEKETLHVIPVQRQAKEKALLLLGSILSRSMTDFLYKSRNEDAPEGLVFNQEIQLADLKKLDQQHPKIVRSKSVKQFQKSTIDADIYLVAQDWIEEALLVLLSLEQLTGPSAKYDYKLSLHKDTDKDIDTSALYDNITILLGEQRKYASLMNILERGLSRYSENIHFWYQFALVLMKSKKYARALKVLNEIISMDPNDADSHLFAARLCLQYIPGKTREALEHAEKAIEIGGLHAMRSYQMQALAYSQLSKEVNSKTERALYEKKCLAAFRKAYECDSNDYLLCYHMALQYAEQREIQKAFYLVKKSLLLNTKCVEAWMLLILLFTCGKDYAQALKTVKVAMLEHPKNLKLIFVNARLREMLNGDAKVKKIYDKLLRILDSYKNGEPSSFTGNDHVNISPEQASFTEESLRLKLQKRALKTAQMYLYIADALMRLDVGEDILPDALNRISEAKILLGKVIIETLPGQVRSTITISAIPQQNPELKAEDTINMCSDIFESFVIGNYSKSVASDSNFFKQLQKVCADVCYYEGRYREETGDDTAVKKYENALVCNANHLLAQIRLGIIMYKQYQKLMLANSYLQNAVRIDPSSHEAWFHLGMVMREMGDLKGASECLMASIKLEKTAPLVPFDHVLTKKL
jgi:tetratricopeptide (TPR) repeat protein